MHYLEIDVSDGSEESPVEIPHVSSHTIVRVNFIGSTDTVAFLHLPDDADIGDLFEIVSLNTVVSVTNANIFGIATSEFIRSVLSIRKVLENSETTDRSWVGARSAKPSWI